MKNVIYQRVDTVCLVVHGPGDPTHEEWETLIAETLRDMGQYTRMLVFTEGGGPNSAQRSRMGSEKRYNAIRTAVMTDSRLIRGVITAFSWMGRNCQGFKRSDMDGAAQYLQLNPDLKMKVWRVLQQLQQQVNTKVA